MLNLRGLNILELLLNLLLLLLLLLLLIGSLWYLFAFDLGFGLSITVLSNYCLLFLQLYFLLVIFNTPFIALFSLQHTVKKFLSQNHFFMCTLHRLNNFFDCWNVFALHILEERVDILKEFIKIICGLVLAYLRGTLLLLLLLTLRLIMLILLLWISLSLLVNFGNVLLNSIFFKDNALY